MKFWQRPNGDCGTRDDDGYVPNSLEITEAKYRAWVNAIPIVLEPFKIIEFEDMETGQIHKFKQIKSYTEARFVNEPLFTAEMEEWRTNNLSK